MNETYKDIKRHAYDTCRYAANDDRRAKKSYRQWLFKARSCPSYAEGIFSRAIADTFDHNIEFVEESSISEKDKDKLLLKRTNNLSTNIKRIQKNNKKPLKELFDSYKNVYPKYYKHRKVINALVHDQSNNLQKCSDMKLIKKLLFCFMK